MGTCTMAVLKAAWGIPAKLLVKACGSDMIFHDLPFTVHQLYGKTVEHVDTHG